MIEFLRHNPLFNKIANISLLSKVGDRLFYTAMLTAAAMLPESNIGVMIVSVSETLPVLLSFYLGALADRKKSKVRLLVQVSIFRAVMYLGIGLIFHYHSGLLLLTIASLFNLFSDIGGNYSSALISPFTKVLISKDDMENAQGYISLGSQLVNVLATFVGSILLSFFSKSGLAIINALVFLEVGYLYHKLHKDLNDTENNLKISKQHSVLLTVKENFVALFKVNNMAMVILQLALLNGLFGGLTPIFTLFLKNNTSLNFLTSSIKIALLSGIVTVSMIVGNFLSPKYLRNVSIKKMCLFADSFVILIGLSFVINNLYLILTFSAILSFLLGIISPRFSATVINESPSERLGGIITSINSLLVIMPPITSVIFPLLANVTLFVAYIGFIAYGLLLIIVSFILLKM